MRGSQPATFFSDEWRNPVYVRDLQRLVKLLIAQSTEPEAEATGTEAAAKGGAEAGTAPQLEQGGLGSAHQPRRIPRVLNTGGPERLSRVDMARQVRTARHDFCKTMQGNGHESREYCCT